MQAAPFHEDILGSFFLNSATNQEVSSWPRCPWRPWAFSWQIPPGPKPGPIKSLGRFPLTSPGLQNAEGTNKRSCCHQMPQTWWDEALTKGNVALCCSLPALYLCSCTNPMTFGKCSPQSPRCCPQHQTHAQGGGTAHGPLLFSPGLVWMRFQQRFLLLLSIKTASLCAHCPR